MSGNGNDFDNLLAANDIAGMKAWIVNNKDKEEIFSNGRPLVNGALYSLIGSSSFNKEVFDLALKHSDPKWDHSLALSLAQRYGRRDIFAALLPLSEPTACVPDLDIVALEEGDDKTLQLLAPYLDPARDQSFLLQVCAARHPESLAKVWNVCNPFDALGGLNAGQYYFDDKDIKKSIKTILLYSETVNVSRDESRAWETLRNMARGQLRPITKENIDNLLKFFPRLLGFSVNRFSLKATKKLLALNVCSVGDFESEALRFAVLSGKKSLVPLLLPHSDASTMNGVAILNALKSGDKDLTKTLFRSLEREKWESVKHKWELAPNLRNDLGVVLAELSKEDLLQEIETLKSSSKPSSSKKM